MKYIDFHCDALTQEGVLQVTKENLRKGGCLLQCFAAFVSAREGRYSAALSLCDKFEKLCAADGYNVVRRVSDIREDKINALLTVEEGGAIEGDLQKLQALYARGVRLMTLTWNYPNEIGFPNLNMNATPFRPCGAPPPSGIRGEVRDQQVSPSSFLHRETEQGLTDFGRACVKKMIELGMMVDVSHGSDKLFFDVAEICRARKTPFVASHSGSATVYPHTRNLTDEQIQTLADCGGVVGLDFCADFLSDEKSAEGQRAAILAHAEHILKIGGEDVLAIGSDFDGIPENAYMKTPANMPNLLAEFEKLFGSRITEKIASGNALRVFHDILQ